jgi:hypothetical protein
MSSGMPRGSRVRMLVGFVNFEVSAYDDLARNM